MAKLDACELASDDCGALGLEASDVCIEFIREHGPALLAALEDADRLKAALAEEQSVSRLGHSLFAKALIAGDKAANSEWHVRVMEKLARFQETCDDDESFDIGREWADALVLLGLLCKPKRGRWQMTEAGQAALDSRPQESAP